MFLGPLLLAASYIGGWLLQALSLLTATLVAAASGLLNWVISGIDWKYTSGGIVDIGWSMTRDLANIFFVLAMVVIGLATALRYKDYQAQKALPLLIGVALLINFTPVITGLIVDATNIVMNFFLSELSGGQYFEAHMAAQRSIMPASIWEGLNPFKATEQLFGALLLIFSDLIVFFILLVYAFLFFMRYVAIWVLVILSPIAFASYVLPATRGFWNTWWKQFVQWSIIGVFGAFFLYLGEQMFGALEILKTPSRGFSGPVDMFINLMPLYAIIVFYIMGFVLSLSTSATGAQAFVSFAKTSGQKAGKWATKAGWARTKTWAKEKQPSWMRKAGEKMAKVPTPKPSWGAEQKTVGGWFKRRAADIVSGAAATPMSIGRTMGRVVGPGITESRSGAITKAEGEAEKIGSVSLLLSKIRGALAPGGSIDEAIGLTSGGIKKGSIFRKTLQEELTDAEKIRLGVETNKLGAVHVAERLGRAFTNQSGKMGFGPLSAADAMKYINITEKLIDEATKDEIKDFGKNFWTSSEAMQAIQKFWGGPQLGKAADEFGRKFVDDYMEVTGKLSADQLIRINPKAALYLSGTAAQDLGFRSPEGLSSEQIREKVKKEYPRGGKPADEDLVSLNNAIREAGFPPATPLGPPPGKPLKKIPRGGQGVGDQPSKPPRGRRGV